MTKSPSSPPPTREQVLEFLQNNPGLGSKRDIARGLDIGPECKAELRRILQDLEAEGALVRTGKRAFTRAEAPPPTGVVLFERIDSDGELIGRANGREGSYGPDIIYAGALGRSRSLALGIGEKALCRIDQTHDGQWRARAIKKLDAEPSATQIGVYRANKYGGVVEPTSRKEKSDFIIERPDSRGAVDGDLVRIMQKATKAYGPKRASVIEVIGRADDPRAASIIAMHTHGVPDEFPEVVLKEAETARPLKAPREDLTTIPLITIDPEDARDHDDAVWAEPNEKGWRVVVAIADVSAYVRHGTHLDREAFRRGNSTYFPDRVSPMLPEHLSADLCSLKEGVLRETMAVEMFFSANGHKMSHLPHLPPMPTRTLECEEERWPIGKAPAWNAVDWRVQSRFDSCPFRLRRNPRSREGSASRPQAGLLALRVDSCPFRRTIDNSRKALEGLAHWRGHPFRKRPSNAPGSSILPPSATDWRDQPTAGDGDRLEPGWASALGSSTLPLSDPENPRRNRKKDLTRYP